MMLIAKYGCSGRVVGAPASVYCIEIFINDKMVLLTGKNINDLPH